ncbi:MAG: AAA family ATPase [Planctomycetes bacterium]|nr:AAA family ATPase [Planctomycetota bacterium]
MQTLSQIKISNYRSFTHEAIKFEGVTCVVGANESGKSNLLNAINHLSPKNQGEPFELNELRIGSLGYPRGEICITYKILMNKTLLGDYYSLFPCVLDKYIIVTKRGLPTEKPVWEGKVEVRPVEVPEIVSIKNKTKFKKLFSNTKVTQQRVKQRWFIKDSMVDLRKQPYKKLLDEGTIEVIEKQDKIPFLSDIIKNELLKNIKIFKWSYQQKDFLSEKVDIDPFINKPSQFPTVKSMFQIAGWKTNQFETNLKNLDDMVYGNLFAQVEREINSLIKNNWNTHTKLTLDLQHKGSYFTIHLKQPGSRTPPEYRSDGLKWYLTFLINFRAQCKSLKNYILLIDEPGLHLHPRGQKDTLQELETLNKKHQNQVIYTTHQTFLINKNNPNNVRVIERKLDKSGALSRNPFFASKVTDVSSKKKHILTDKLLREALGFAVSDISPINEKNVLVEGVLERELMHMVNQKWPIFDLNEASIIACGGAPKIAKHAALYKENGLKVVCFYDGDNAGISSCNNNKKVLDSEKRHLKQIVTGDNYETIEDVIPDAIFDVACNKWFKACQIEKIPVSRPRMKTLDRCMQKISREIRLEMKHNLEDGLIQETRKNIHNNENDFQPIKSIIQELKKRM